MYAPLISFETVREIMTSWMTQYTEDWDNEGRRWRYESNTHDFSWYKYSKGLFVGASLSDEGTVITIWTGTMDNDNIIVSKDGIIFNDHSDFDQGFEHGQLYDLYMKLKYRDNSEEAEKITNECLKKESKCTGVVINQIPGIKVKQKFDTDYFEICNAYAIYDKTCECRHGLLANMNENLLSFRIYSSANNSYQLDIKIDEFINGVYTIKPLIADEQ
jgi:hypothetical protein